MLIEQALMTFLLADETLDGLVDGRIHYVQAPQEVTAPYLVISKIDGPRVHSHEGGDGIAHPRFQFSAFAEKYGTCKSIIAAVQSALDGYTGMMGGESGVAVKNAVYDDENDLERGEQGLYGVAADYIIWHRE